MRLALALCLLASPVLAEAPPVETSELGASVVTLHVLPSLDQAELSTLRVVATNEQALALFVPEGGKGFSAIAISPSEGFMRDNAPVTSASAIAGLADAATAAADAIATCEAARDPASEPCVVVLEIAPKG
jgi:hypothetical protein